MQGHYLLAERNHEDALQTMFVPAEQYYGDEEYGGFRSGKMEIRKSGLSDIPPSEIEGLRTYSTRELARMIKGEAIVLIDVANSDEAIPGAKTLLFGGVASDDGVKDEAIGQRFSGLLPLLVADRSSKLVFYSKKRDWYSINAAVRAKHLGYPDVGWYRGGVQSWKAAGLPVVPAIIGAVAN